MDDQLLAMQRGEGAGPGLKTSPAILQLHSRAHGKVHAAVFAVEQRREGSALVILRLGVYGSVGKAVQSLDHQRRSGLRQHVEKSYGGLIRSDFDGLLK